MCNLHYPLFNIAHEVPLMQCLGNQYIIGYYTPKYYIYIQRTSLAGRAGNRPAEPIRPAGPVSQSDRPPRPCQPMCCYGNVAGLTGLAGQAAGPAGQRSSLDRTEIL